MNPLIKKGFPREAVMSHLNQANSIKGVLLGIGERILEKGYEYDEEDYAFKIHSPSGLEIKYINRIIPQGEIERKILSDYLY